ncbi:MAG: threonine-phosphate decarboxylase CobD, partial [Pseudomonadota bacterium]
MAQAGIDRGGVVEKLGRGDRSAPVEHGGNLDRAVARFGGQAADWIDLSTGINRTPYPLPEIPSAAYQRLPLDSDVEALLKAARTAYRTDAPMVPLAGAQAAIQLIPNLMPVGRVAIVSPTYNEFNKTFRQAGWRVFEVGSLADAVGCDVAVVVNPNNPDGRTYQPADLLKAAASVELLIVDESFCDPTPELSLAPAAGSANLIVLRSFGKFYGLAGLRLGFAISNRLVIERLERMAGPWAVSGPAIAVGRQALADVAWQKSAKARLRADADHLQTVAAELGWSPIGRTALFHLFNTPHARRAQAALAGHKIWTRIFPFSDTLIRLGLPGSPAEWARLRQA